MTYNCLDYNLVFILGKQGQNTSPNVDECIASLNDINRAITVNQFATIKVTSVFFTLDPLNSQIFVVKLRDSFILKILKDNFFNIINKKDISNEEKVERLRKAVKQEMINQGKSNLADEYTLDTCFNKERQEMLLNGIKRFLISIKNTSTTVCWQKDDNAELLQIDSTIDENMTNSNLYVKKPIPIKAFDFSISKVDDHMTNLFDGIENGQYFINTLEGKHYIKEDDFVIIGVRGERYPIKRDIFFETYEKFIPQNDKLNQKISNHGWSQIPPFLGSKGIISLINTDDLAVLRPIEFLDGEKKIQGYKADKKAFACANYILDNLQNEGINDLTNLQLAKLLYFAYGIHLALYNKPLFDEKIQAWRFGPVVPSVYREFKNFDLSPIGSNSRAKIIEDFTGEVITPNLTSLDNQENAEKSLLIACVCFASGEGKAMALVNESYTGEGSVWAKVYNKDRSDRILNNDDIIKEFDTYFEKIGNYLFSERYN